MKTTFLGIAQAKIFGGVLVTADLVYAASFLCFQHKTGIQPLVTILSLGVTLSPISVTIARTCPLQTPLNSSQRLR